ncbi:MAG TPA: endolytic transglycosylase MltG [Terracidiphilus sp.]|nr:endolytic transglycosylase MltG [Terracidiphilus sp.]
MVRRRRASEKKRGVGAAGILLIAFFVIIGLAVGAGWLLYTPYGPDTETFVEVPPGTSAVRIGKMLEAQGIVRTRFVFDAVRTWKGGTLRAGEYRFDRPETVAEVYERIQRGDVFTKSVTIPEGASMFDIAARLEQAGLGTQQQFLTEATRQTALIADLDPKAKSLEGYLFPDTYHFSRKATPEQIATAMVKRFRQAAQQLGLTQNVHAVVTMASLVERETAVDAERPLVASVFENRLAKNMPLMTDPSVIYGLQLQRLWRGTIYASDLKRDTPYNTYLHAGLPPGPVANPGIPALRAAMQPAQTNYLYFVAANQNPQGRSMFAATLDEHNRNVASYRHAMKKAGSR